MNERAEYDLRQLRMMQKTIKRYLDNEMYLADLVSDLEALHNCLQNPSSAWTDEFTSAWGVLEDVYADILDRGETNTYREKYIALISSAIDRLTLLISREIETITMGLDMEK